MDYAISTTDALREPALGLRILVVDDNRDLADGLAALLVEERHTAVVAYDGESAVAASRESPFDLVLMDFKLPDLSGIEAMSRISRDREGCRFAIMTGFRLDQLLEDLVRSGSTRVLRHPFSAEDLLEAIAQARPAGIVLLVVKQAGSADRIEAWLAAHGMRVLTARRPAEALEADTAVDADVLLLDMEPPLMQCLEVFCQLQERGLTMPAIILTPTAGAGGVASDVLRSPSLTGCFFKPFEPDVLLDELAALAPPEDAEGVEKAG